MTDLSDWGPSGAVQMDAGFVPARPRLGMADILLQLWRAKWLMMLIGIPIFALGLLLAFQMPKTFESRSALYVTSGDEVRSSSILSDPSFDPGPGIQEVIQGELQILQTQLVAERTLARFPLDRIYPDLAKAKDREIAKTDPALREAVEFEYFQKGVEALQKNLWSNASPNSNIIAVGFKHKDPQVASEILNAAMAVYLQRRAELFGSRPVDQLRAERKRFEGELLEIEAEIAQFLRDNDIRDFASERSTAQSLYAAISTELFNVNARASAVQGQVGRTRTQLQATAPEQDLYVEDSSAQRLRELEIERNQALVNYTPDSRRVQSIDRQIDELREFLAAQDRPVGTVRRGPNPTYQALETALNTSEAEAASLNEQRAELQRQLRAVEDKLNRFTTLEPEWNELQRNRDLIEASIRTVAEREQREGTVAGLTSQEADSVKVTEPATVPIEGNSLKLPVAVLALLFAGFTALIAGLMRTFTRRGFSTPASLQNTVGLPVLGTVRAV
ncbi:MAG: Wzz/FepE/Etk N-terminal domain-containing protein [Hyphomonadaceae bacterium]|nr:Wzz/FepE/Etk N-terminal domain-containing protein [Hyphomonadaceae bacterium]